MAPFWPRWLFEATRSIRGEPTLHLQSFRIATHNNPVHHALTSWIFTTVDSISQDLCHGPQLKSSWTYWNQHLGSSIHRKRQGDARSPWWTSSDILLSQYRLEVCFPSYLQQLPAAQSISPRCFATMWWIHGITTREQCEVHSTFYRRCWGF